MSKLFKSKKAEVSKTEIDPQIYNRVLGNLQFAEQVAAIPYEPYRGLMVAPFTRDYMAGEAATRGIAQEGGFVPEIEAAARSAAGLMGFQPERVSAGRVGTRFGAAPIEARDIGRSLAGGPREISAGQVSTTFAPERIAAERIGQSLGMGPMMVSAGQVGTQFSPQQVAADRIRTQFSAREVSVPTREQTPMAQAASFLGEDLSRYINPYQQAVIETGLEDIDRAERARQSELARRASAARAFGGSRQAVEAGIAAGEAARERNRYIAEQRAQSFREAAGIREADVGRQQQVALANQAAIQNVMELAQRGEISNQQRDLELERLGTTAEQANQEAGLRAAMANQAAMQQAEQMRLMAETTNLEAGLRSSLANQQAVQDYMRMGLTAEQANQQAGLDAAARNQAAGQEAQRMGLAAETTNVGAALEAARANQNTVQQYMQMGLSAEEANQRAQMEASSRNQQAVLEAQRMGSAAQQFNVQSALEAALANQGAGMQGAQFQLAAGRQLGDLGQQALGNRYGAASALMGIGTAQQQLYQQFLNAQREEDLRRQQFPLQQLAIRQGAVQASPMNQTTTGTVTSRPSYWEMAGRVAAAFGSDENMKKNIKGIKNPLDKVNRLKGIEFEWEDGYSENEGEDKGGEEDMGMSAQSIEKVMPEAVSRRESDGMRQYNLPQLVGLLTEAVKELDQKVEGGKRRGKA